VTNSQTPGPVKLTRAQVKAARIVRNARKRQARDKKLEDKYKAVLYTALGSATSGVFENDGVVLPVVRVDTVNTERTDETVLRERFPAAYAASRVMGSYTTLKVL